MGPLADPTSRAQDYTDIGNNPRHEFRSNGTFELPFGPNKLVAGNSSGWVARAIEKWQMGVIYNYSVGAPASITMNTMLYGNGLPDVRHPVDFNELRGVRWGIQNGVNLEGRYFDNNDKFLYVPDPQCLAVTTAQNLYSAAGATGTPRCTLQCVGDGGCSGYSGLGNRSQLLRDFDSSSFCCCRYSDCPDRAAASAAWPEGEPGQQRGFWFGLLPLRCQPWQDFPDYRIQESPGSFRRTERSEPSSAGQSEPKHRSRIPATAPFGQITGKTGTRTMQGQLRFSF